MSAQKDLSTPGGVFAYLIDGGNEKGISVIQYTPKSVCVLDTQKKYAKELLELGGMFRNNWKCGAGYIFPLARLQTIKDFITTGNIPQSMYAQQKAQVAQQFVPQQLQSLAHPPAQQAGASQEAKYVTSTAPATAPATAPETLQQRLDHIDACLSLIMTKLCIEPPSRGVQQVSRPPQTHQVSQIQGVQGIVIPQGYQAPVFSYDGDDNAPDAPEDTQTDTDGRLPSLAHRRSKA